MKMQFVAWTYGYCVGNLINLWKVSLLNHTSAHLVIGRK